MNDTPAGTTNSRKMPRQRRVPRGTAVLLGVSVFSILAVAPDWFGLGLDGGLFLMLPIPMGIVGTIWAACSRSVELAHRAVWMIISAVFAPTFFFLYWIVGTATFGP